RLDDAALGVDGLLAHQIHALLDSGVRDGVARRLVQLGAAADIGKQHRRFADLLRHLAAGLPYGVIVPGSKKIGAQLAPRASPCPPALFTGRALPALFEAIRRRDAGLVDAVIHRRRRADVAGEAVVDLLRYAVGRLRVLQGLRRDLRHRRTDRRRHREHARASRAADATIVVEHVRAGVLRARREG